MKGAALVGALVLGVHAVALPLLLDHCKRPGLEVALRGAPTSARFDLAGDPTVPATVTRDGDGPGIHRVSWRVDYRGGFTDEVGAAQLVGPFQDPAHPACGVRLVVGQRFLDREVAPLVASGIATAMKGFDEPLIGKLRKVRAVDVRWARFDDSPGDRVVFGELGGAAVPALAAEWHTEGYARVHVAVELDRVDADIVVALVPRVAQGQLAFALYAHADVSTGNGVADWALRTFHADAYATDAVRGQIDKAIVQAFDAPPPLDLGNGRTLRVAYCAGATLAVASNQYATLPLALAFDGAPVRLGAATPPPPAPDTVLAFDLDLDTVNALLDTLWRDGFLDEQLAAAGLDRRFDEDPTVQDLLTLRISPLRLALPPVVTPDPRDPHALRMAADLRVELDDRGAHTPARVWGALALDLGETGTTAALAELALTCEPAPDHLRPCYGDLVAAMRERAGDARDELSATLRTILDELFAGARVAAPATPITLVLGAPRTTATASGASATVRIEIDAHLLGS